MRYFRLFALAFTILMLAACDTGEGALPLPGVAITDVSSSTLAPGDEVAVTGTGFYQTSGTALTRVEVCGVSVTATLVEPVSQLVVLPPGGTVTVRTGSALTFTVPGDGFTGGEGQELTVSRPDGGSATFGGITCVAPVAEPEPVAADLSASSTTGVAPATIEFSAAGSAGEGELSFSWDFGDEVGTSTIAEPEYTYGAPGVFTVTLTVTDETEATATATQVITVDPPLQAVIRRSGITGVAPVTVEFDGTYSTGIAPLSYEWDFGVPGASSSDAETSFEFEVAGTFEVSLTVTDANGDSSTAMTEVEIPAAAPVAVISASSTVGPAPLTVEFDATGSTGQGDLTYHWNFDDDGAESTDATPTHTFESDGTYTVDLTVRDEEGQEGSASVDIVVDPALAGLAFHVFPPVPAVITVQDEHGNEYELGPDDYILQGIPAGDYTIVPNDYGFSNPTPPYTALYSAPNGLLTLEPGDDRSIDVTYEAVAGSLELSDAGLPGDVTFADSVLTLTPNSMPAGYGSEVDTSDWSNLIPGVYMLEVSGIEVQRGEGSNSWVEEYESTQSKQTILISSNETTEREIDYTLTPVGSLDFGDVNGDLPEGVAPEALLEDDQGQVQSDWENLLPGPYQLTLNPVDHINAGAFEFDGETHDAYERYILDGVDPLTLYLSSGEHHTIPGIPYELEPALLSVTVTPPPLCARGS